MPLDGKIKAMPNKAPLRRTPLKRSTKPIARIGARGLLKREQKRAAKLEYARSFGGMLGGVPIGPCQLCERVLNIQQADFSHKVPAGRGGDKGAKVHASNGVWSCRACHEFCERTASARRELIDSPASLESGGLVKFSPEVAEMHRKFLRAWHGGF